MLKGEEVIGKLAQSSACARCRSVTARTVAMEEKLRDGIETVRASAIWMRGLLPVVVQMRL